MKILIPAGDTASLIGQLAELGQWRRPCTADRGFDHAIPGARLPGKPWIHPTIRNEERTMKKKMLSSLVFAMVLAFASSAKADDSDGVRMYKTQVTNIVGMWGQQLRPLSANLAKVKEDLAKLKAGDSAYATKKAEAKTIYAMMQQQTAMIVGQINTSPVHTADKSESAALPDFVKKLIDDKARSFKNTKVMANASWGGKDTDGAVTVSIAVFDL
jgi:hypothetical protein